MGEVVKVREKYWIEHYCKLGYRLLNVIGNNKRWPQFLSSEEKREQERFRAKVINPILMRIDKTGLEKLLDERYILEDFYEVESKLIAGLLESMLNDNKLAIEQLLIYDNTDSVLVICAREAIEKSLPERSDVPTLGDLKRNLRKKTGLSPDASLQDCIDVVIHPGSRKPEPTPKTFFETYKQESDDKLSKIEQDVFDRIERGEIEGVTADILREAIGSRKQPAGIADHLDEMPALKHYLQVTEEKGDDWYVFYMGKEPSKKKREKVEALKQESAEKMLKSTLVEKEVT